LRRALGVLGAIATLVVVIVAVVFHFTSDLVNVSDAFFKAAAAGEMQAARSYLAADFRAATSEDELRAFLGRSALLDYSEGHWSNREVSIGRGTLRGEVKTKSGGRVPLTLTFVKESTGWKIYSIRKPQAGIVSESGGQTIPSKDEAAKLAVDTTLSFARAVNTSDFKPFYDGTAAEFQSEVPLDKFNAKFAPFIQQHIDLAPAEKITPLLTAEPGVSPQGVLQVNGYFPFTSSHVDFSYKYVYRFTGWKIIGISLHVKSV
jgi:hypothetical protein